MSLSTRFRHHTDLIESLVAQRLVMGDRALAEAIAQDGELLEYAAGQNLIMQGDGDREIYFLIMGKVQVVVHGVRLHQREHGNSVGEMSAVNAHVSRSATIEAVEPTVAWRIGHTRLTAIADDFPALWRRIAIELTSRLEQRNQLINRTNQVTRVFLICSSEALPVARAIRVGLEHDAQVVIWTDENIFPPGAYAIESLENEVNLADFGIALAEPDDLLTSRNKTAPAPRDNVIFELGFFMSRLGRARTLLLVPKTEVKLPSDFKGLTPISYQAGKTPSEMPVALGPTIDRIAGLIKRLGVRSSITQAR